MSLPECEGCGAKHPWLLKVNPQVLSVEWKCVECDTVQTYRTPAPG